MPRVAFAGSCADVAGASGVVVWKGYTERFFYCAYGNVGRKRIFGR